MRRLVRHNRLFAIWSTVVDAPVTEFMPIEELSKKVPEARREMAFAHDLTLDGFLDWNRAGPDETHIASGDVMVVLYGGMR